MIKMVYSVDIKGIGAYFPNNVVANDYFVEYFKDNEEDVPGMLKMFGRNVRHISDEEDENSVTMAVKACNEALEKTDLSAKDIDLLIFSSGTPEYLAPANALKIHNLIGGKETAIAYDMNANCVGMLIAIEQASRYLANSSLRYAMVVGSEQMNRYSQDSDVITKCNFGDAACAVILEKTDRAGSGFKDAVYHVNSEHTSVMLFPECGLSNIYKNNISEQEKRILWKGGNAGNGFALTKALIESLLKKSSKNIAEIKKFFISQVCRQNINDLADSLGEDQKKFVYVGDKFGYTGTSSPLVALNYAIETGQVKRGDDIIFWSIGTGYISCAILWKY
jgi:3-oxoacyl-[acyl-carrier-protein] synthase-3